LLTSQGDPYRFPDAPHIAKKGHWFGARDSLIGKVIKCRRDIPVGNDVWQLNDENERKINGNVPVKNVQSTDRYRPSDRRRENFKRIHSRTNGKRN